nr:MAG TPA: hypothetical protein [Caudoviricetes sp.]
MTTSKNTNIIITYHTFILYCMLERGVFYG